MQQIQISLCKVFQVLPSSFHRFNCGPAVFSNHLQLTPITSVKTFIFPITVGDLDVTPSAASLLPPETPLPPQSAQLARWAAP